MGKRCQKRGLIIAVLCANTQDILASSKDLFDQRILGRESSGACSGRAQHTERLILNLFRRDGSIAQAYHLASVMGRLSESLQPCAGSVSLRPIPLHPTSRPVRQRPRATTALVVESDDGCCLYDKLKADESTVIINCLSKSRVCIRRKPLKNLVHRIRTTHQRKGIECAMRYGLCVCFRFLQCMLHSCRRHTAAPKNAVKIHVAEVPW